MAQFPSLKAKKMLAILMRSPLNYRATACKGSHRSLKWASGYPDIGFSFHDKATIPGFIVRDMLVNRVHRITFSE